MDRVYDNAESASGLDCPISAPRVGDHNQVGVFG